MDVLGGADVPDWDACAARASDSRQLGRTAAHIGIRGIAGSASVRWCHPDTQVANLPRDRGMDARRHGRRRAPCARLQEHRTRTRRVRAGMGVVAGGRRSHRHPLHNAGVVGRWGFVRIGLVEKQPSSRRAALARPSRLQWAAFTRGIRLAPRPVEARASCRSVLGGSLT